MRSISEILAEVVEGDGYDALYDLYDPALEIEPTPEEFRSALLLMIQNCQSALKEIGE